MPLAVFYCLCLSHTSTKDKPIWQLTSHHSGCSGFSPKCDKPTFLFGNYVDSHVSRWLINRKKNNGSCHKVRMIKIKKQLKKQNWRTKLMMILERQSSMKCFKIKQYILLMKKKAKVMKQSLCEKESGGGSCCEQECDSKRMMFFVMFFFVCFLSSFEWFMKNIKNEDERCIMENLILVGTHHFECMFSTWKCSCCTNYFTTDTHRIV